MRRLRSAGRLRLVLLVVCCVSLAAPIATQAYYAPLDDDIPGVLTDSPVLGRFSDAGDTHDVFRVDLIAGEAFFAELVGGKGNDIDHVGTRLLPPGTLAVEGATPVAISVVDASVYRNVLDYLVSSSGTYYLDCLPDPGVLVGAYELHWSTDWPRDEGDVPGAPILTSPFSGMMEAELDRDDVYSVYLRAGQQLDVVLNHNSGRDFDLYLFPPSIRSIDETGRAVASSDETGTSEHLEYVAPVSGTYNLDVRARSGSGRYQVTWSRKTTKASVSTPVVATSMAYGRTYKATGYLTPWHPAGSAAVRLQAYHQERQRNGAYKWVLRKTQTAVVGDYSSDSRYSAPMRLPLRGRWRIRAYHSDAGHTAAYSSFRYVTVR